MIEQGLLWEEKLKEFLTNNPPPDSGVRIVRVMSIVEKYLCEWAYEKCGKVRARGARLLGIERTTFYEKQKRWGIVKTVSRGERGTIISKYKGHGT